MSGRRLARASLAISAQLLIVGTSCLSTRLDPIRGPDFVPLPDERELWDASARYHEAIDESGLRVEDDALHAYLTQQMEEILAAMGFEGSLARIRILWNPYLNAHVTPDGVIYLNSGILARLDNEAQLATLLGHELTHFLHRHGIKLKRRTGNRYSREHETEADRLGLEAMSGAGYDPAEAVAFLELLLMGLREEGANLEDPIFHSSHPRITDRLASYRLLTVSSESEEPSGSAQVGSRVGALAYQMAVKGLLLENAGFDFSLGRRASAERALDRLLQHEPESIEAWALLGHVHSERSGDTAQIDAAIRAFERAAALDPDSASLQRELGLLYHSRGRGESARVVLQRYLELAPEAVDRPIVESLINGTAP